MRAYHFIPLGLALAGLAFWNFTQRQAEGELVAQSRELQGKITTAQQQAKVPTTTSGKPKSGARALDWTSLAARLVAAQQAESPTPDAALEGNRERLAQMTAAELLAALEEVSTLGLAAEAKAALEETLAEALITQDPALALVTFADRIQDESDGVGWQLAGALREWAKRDLAAASAWFDQEIAAGRFESKSLDGQSEARLEFEAALLEPLLSSAPKTAAARLAALPEDQRRSALEQIDTTEIGATGQQAYMDLLRKLLPPDERGDALSHLISEMIPDGDYPQITEFLNTIQATPEERAVATRTAVGNELEEIASERSVTRDDLEVMRRWLAQQAPTAVDRLTGEALGEAIQDGGDFNFTQAAALVADYHQSSGNDDLITGFLTSAAADDSNPEAVALAGKIKDPKRRAEALANLK